MNITMVNACNEYYTIPVHVPPTFEVYCQLMNVITCSVFVNIRSESRSMSATQSPIPIHQGLDWSLTLHFADKGL